MTSTKKPVALAIGATLAGGLMLSGSAFASTQLAQGYLLAGDQAASAKAGEGSCGAHKKAGMEGKCGEGSCGMAAMDTDKDGKISRAEFTAAHPGMAGDFDSIDTNKDGVLDANEEKVHMEGRCGSDKVQRMDDSGKKATEGKCGEGKCGGSL